MSDLKVEVVISETIYERLHPVWVQVSFYLNAFSPGVFGRASQPVGQIGFSGVSF